MKSIQMSAAGLLIFLLAACQSIPPEIATETQACAAEVEAEIQVCPELTCPVLACPEPEVIEKTVTKYVPAPIDENSPVVIGAVEWALVEPGNVVLEARIDSGAETSSIHAENIQLLEKDGKRYVRFTLEDPDTKEEIALERRLHRRIVVKQNVDGPPDRRYVVRMWVTLGKTRTWLDVSLNDRDEFEYALLLGRNMLVDEFVVDVSRHHTQSKKSLKSK